MSVTVDTSFDGGTSLDGLDSDSLVSMDTIKKTKMKSPTRATPKRTASYTDRIIETAKTVKPVSLGVLGVCVSTPVPPPP